MKIIFLSLLMLGLGSVAKSQAAEDSVKATIEQLFLAMKTSDAALLVACFADSAMLQTIGSDKQGAVTVKNENIKNFAASISKAPKGALDERINFNMIKIDGALASVWTPYSFYYNGNFSHCGANSFQLIRTRVGWKIQYLIDTRRKTGCE
ncbi:MAG: nuclear transport factor 2 family protein [Gloeobacteraceae cyanobacterium ES-bin-316]|nr:nuclear transport factor 2 family protein [Ferruginibacter sp.]